MKWRLVVAVTALGFGAAAAPSAAATFTVAGLGDPVGATCAGTVCESLRAAVTAAEQPANVGSTVSLGGGTYTLGGPGSTGGPLTISVATSVTIAGSAGTTIQQTGAGDGVVAITSAIADVTLSDLTITGGSAVGASAPALPPPTPGGAGQDAVGGIVDAGALTLHGVAVTGNSATGGSGGDAPVGGGGPGGRAVGAIDVTGSLIIDGGSVSDNSATGGRGGYGTGTDLGGGGGVAVAGIAVDSGAGPVTIAGADLSGNTATGGTGGASDAGSGIHQGIGGAAYGALAGFGGQAVSVAGSTVNANTATGGHGGYVSTVSAPGPGGAAMGGGISDSGGPLSVSDSSIDGDAATGGSGSGGPIGAGSGGGAQGGGIFVVGPASLALARSTLALDSATGGATASVTSMNNVNGGAGADGLGGAIEIMAAGTIVNSTFAKDSATGSAGGAPGGSGTAGSAGRGIGGAISVLPPSAGLTLTGITFAQNASLAAGGGLTYGADLVDGTAVDATLSNSIVGAGIGAPACSVLGILTDSGHNLLETGPATACGLTAASDLIGSNPQLGPLADNGGPGPTLAPAATSPARGAGGACGASLPVDERGTPRHPLCDIGAYETQPPVAGATPALAGPGAVGTAITCPTDSFTGDTPLTFTFVWRRDGVPIIGATNAVYTPVAADAGHMLNCTITAANAYGTASATTTSVTIAVPSATPPPTTPAKFRGASLKSTKLIADRKGHVTLSVSCPADTPGHRCAIKVAVYGTAGKLPDVAAAVHQNGKPKKPRRAALLAKGNANIAAGKTRALKLKLNRAGKRALKHLPARVRVILTASDTEGKVVTISARASVIAAKPTHKPKHRKPKRGAPRTALLSSSQR